MGLDSLKPTEIDYTDSDPPPLSQSRIDTSDACFDCHESFNN